MQSAAQGRRRPPSGNSRLRSWWWRRRGSKSPRTSPPRGSGLKWRPKRYAASRASVRVRVPRAPCPPVSGAHPATALSTRRPAQAEIFNRALRDHPDDEVARMQQYTGTLGNMITTFGAGSVADQAALSLAKPAAAGTTPSDPGPPLSPAAAAAAPAATAVAALAAPATAVSGAELPKLSSVDEAYWIKLDRLRPYKRIAEKYIGTLQKERGRVEAALPGILDAEQNAHAQRKRAYFETVEKHCRSFARMCEDTRESYQVTPNLRNLNDMETLLKHISSLAGRESPWVRTCVPGPTSRSLTTPTRVDGRNCSAHRIWLKSWQRSPSPRFGLQKIRCPSQGKSRWTERTRTLK